MEEEVFHLMYELDSYHWWFYAQRAWLRKFYSRERGRGKKWLDVGCGVGDTLRNLKDDFIVFGVDTNDLALSYCKKRNIPRLTKASGVSLPFRTESFDFVSVLGVMYHRSIESDRQCLKESVRVCKKNGLLFFQEPVELLRGKHDVIEHTARRYSWKSLKKLVSSEALEIKKISYFCFFAFFPIFLIRRFQKKRPGDETAESDLKKPNKLINSLMILLTTLESFWVRYLPFPIGSSIICVAKKRK